MIGRKIVLCGVSLFSLFLISGCDAGDGQVWEPIEFEGVPYTEERTAGRGVKYVLAAMAPKKGPVLEPIMPPAEKVEAPKISLPEPPEPEIQNATPIFQEGVKESK